MQPESRANTKMLDKYSLLVSIPLFDHPYIVAVKASTSGACVCVCVCGGGDYIPAESYQWQGPE